MAAATPELRSKDLAARDAGPYADRSVSCGDPSASGRPARLAGSVGTPESRQPAPADVPRTTPEARQLPRHW